MTSGHFDENMQESVAGPFTSHAFLPVPYEGHRRRSIPAMVLAAAPAPLVRLSQGATAGVQAHLRTPSIVRASLRRRLSILSRDSSRRMGGPGLLLLDPYLAVLPRQGCLSVSRARGVAFPCSAGTGTGRERPTVLEPRLRGRGRTVQPLAPLEAEAPSPISDRSARHPSDRH